MNKRPDSLDNDDSLSIVVPCYNEEETLFEVQKRFEALASQIPFAWELIFVDDGSEDKTWECIQSIAKTNSAFRGIRLSRNFGQQEALLAGLRATKGTLVVTLDADLQDPPELIPEMIEAYRNGADVVYAIRNKREHDPVLKRFFASLFYATIRSATGLDIPSNAGEFRLAKKSVVDAVLDLKEPRPFLRGMFAWVGFSRAYVHFDRPDRFAGEAKFTFSKSLSLAMDAFVSFSQLKQKLLNLTGIITVCAALIGMFLLLLGFKIPATSFLLIILFVLSIQLLINGFLDIDGRVGSHRPDFLVQEEIGVGLSS